MIITHISGGLGNQMFQFAAGYSLARFKETRLMLDTSDYARVRMHDGFLLDRVFDIKADVAGPGDTISVLGLFGIPLAFRVFKKIRKGVLIGGYVRERQPFVYRPDFFETAPADCYLHGSWQSERYFAHEIEAIKTMYTFKPRAIPDEVKRLGEEAGRQNSVAIHVRRGDFANDPKLNRIYGTCGTDYYERAMACMRQRVDRPHFYLFSDEPTWVRQHFQLDGCTVVDAGMHYGSWNDMFLMSRCRHNITANSTFSWWGAWLNSNPHKIVVTPREWDLVGTDMPDLIPHSWVRV